MRGTTQSLYSLALRAQATFGLMLVAGLISAVLVAGQYAGTAMIIGVIAGVISLACVWPYLTPDWLERPSRKGHLVPLLVAHLVLLALYTFTAISSVLVLGMTDAVVRQLAVGVISLLCACGLLNLIMGIRLCLLPLSGGDDGERGTVTELVLPRAPRRNGYDDEEQPRLSQAS